MSCTLLVGFFISIVVFKIIEVLPSMDLNC